VMVRRPLRPPQDCCHPQGAVCPRDLLLLSRFELSAGCARLSTQALSVRQQSLLSPANLLRPASRSPFDSPSPAPPASSSSAGTPTPAHERCRNTGRPCRAFASQVHNSQTAASSSAAVAPKCSPPDTASSPTVPPGSAMPRTHLR